MKRQIVLTLAFLLIAAAALLSSSCNILPVEVVKTDGTHVRSMGATLFTKNSGKEIEFHNTDGSFIKYKTTTEDETAVPLSGIRTAGTYGAAAILGKTMLSKEVTTRNAANQITSQKATSSAASVQKTQIGAAKEVQLKTIEAEAAAVPAP